MDCIFCKIAKGELPSEIVYQDDNLIAFKDVHPKAPLHYLIIPKNHIQSIASDGSEDIAKGLVAVAKKIAKEQNIDDYKLVFNVGEKAGQTVPHLHMHMLAGGEGNV